MRFVALLSLILVQGPRLLGEASGVVYLREGATRQPFPGVRVDARPAGDGPPVQVATTDGYGRYRLRSLPRGRLLLSPKRPGHVARAVASGESTLLIDAGAGEEIADADFEMVPGGVVTGRITDQWGEPREKVNISLFRPIAEAEAGGARIMTGRSDDRGFYRLFGLESGRYLLLARPAQRLNDEPVALYYPGTSDPTRAREFDVMAGEETGGIDIVLRPERTFRIAGRIVEADVETTRLIVHASRATDRVEEVTSAGAPVSERGGFSLRLPGGSYILTAYARPAGGGPLRPLARQVIDLRADVPDLVLRPGRPGRVEGRVVFPPGKSAGLPDAVRIRLRQRGAPIPVFALARAPEFRLEFPELWPGTYAIDLFSPPSAYLKRVRVDSQHLDLPEVVVHSAGPLTVEIEAGLDQGLVAGMVKAPGTKAPQAHARVALARAEGSPSELRSVQADQGGRFVIPDVRPGPYLVGAWTRVAVSRLYGSQAWEQAGAAVKKIVVEPNVEIELELTASQ